MFFYANWAQNASNPLLWVKVSMTMWGQAVRNQLRTPCPSQEPSSWGTLGQPWASGTPLGIAWAWNSVLVHSGVRMWPSGGNCKHGPGWPGCVLTKFSYGHGRSCVGCAGTELPWWQHPEQGIPRGGLLLSLQFPVALQFISQPSVCAHCPF